MPQPKRQRRSLRWTKMEIQSLNKRRKRSLL
jgi:hypothetical protein